MKQILSYFFKGLLYIVPVAVTVYVLVTLVTLADSLFAVVPFVRRVPGSGLILVLVLVTLIGWLGGKLLTPSIVSLFDNTMSRMPFIKLIYTSVRDLMKAFVGEKRKFDHPVMVKMDEAGLNNRLGFITQSDLSTIGLNGMVAVYCPFPYSVMGDLIVVPAANVRPIEGVNSVELMKLVVSGGVAGSDDNASSNRETSDSDKKQAE